MSSHSGRKTSRARSSASDRTLALTPTTRHRFTLNEHLDLQLSDDRPSPLEHRHEVPSMNYCPRRRAMIACEICRSRKSRCDGSKPKCKLCKDLGAECIYREPGIKLDAGDRLILERLDRIEGMLQSAKATTQAERSPVLSQDTSTSGEAALVGSQNNHMSAIEHGGLGAFTQPGPTGTNISTMPRIHTSAALHLLQWPLIRDLVTQQYDPQFLLQLEMEREPLHSLLKTPCLDLSNTQAYIQAFFARVNVWYACVNPYTWESQYRTALSNGFREGPESCIVLLVLALGQASLAGSISQLVGQAELPGLQYFTAAWLLLPGMVTTNNVLATQCHILAAAYLFYAVRPLEAWNLLCSASTKLQLLLMEPSRIPAHQRELTQRIYWNTLLFESDLLAELDLPHSGVVQFEEQVGLPGGFEGEHGEPAGQDELWYFLAEIALRRLLNRVSQLIYSKDSTASTSITTNTANLEPVVAELDYQLTQWYEGLPSPLQFSFARTMLLEPVQSVLRLRYFACRAIIYRPYVLAVLENDRAALDSTVMENCHKCLEACIRQLENLPEHHAGHMPYIWQGALSTVSQALLVMGATLSPPLLNVLLTLIPHREALYKIIHDVVAEMERYAVLAPSLSLAAEIIREAEARWRSFLGG